MNDDNDKRILEQSLANLLGFELEDVSDVMEHLLTFDSQDDLLEYLTDFLGPGHEDQVTSLVSNIYKFQNGAALDIGEEKEGEGGTQDEMDCKEHATKSEKKGPLSSLEEEYSTDERKPAAINPNRVKKGTNQFPQEKAKKKSANLTSTQQRSNPKPKIATKRQTASSKPKKASSPSTSSVEGTNSSKPLSQTTGLEQSTANLSISQSPQESSSSSLPNAPTTKNHQPQTMDPSPSPSLPPIGKASITCGCYGTIHKYLTNCLHCGRIQCEREGYGYCPHCGHLVKKVVPLPSANLSPEERHKERLLQFDREVAQRTQVIDERADDYENSTSQWLTKEERAEAEKKDELKRAELHSIKKVTLNIAF